MSWDKVDDDDDEDEVPTPSANVIGHRHDGDDRSAQGCSNGFPGALTPGVMRNHQREVDSASSTASFTSEDASPAMSSYSGGESLSCTKRNGCCDDDVRDNDSNETEMARSPEGVKSCGSAMPRTVFGAALNTRREKDSEKEIPHMFTVGAGASGARGPSAVSREVLNGDASLPRMRPTHPSSLVQGTCVSFRAPSAEVDMLGGAVLSGYEGSSAQGRVGHENHESHPSGIMGPRKWPLNNALNYENAGAAMQEEGGMVARRSGMSAADRGAEIETQLAEGMVRPGSQMAASSRSTEVDVHLSIEELLGVSTVGTETRDDEIQTACSSMSLSHRAAMVATSAQPSLLQRRESTSLGVPSADRSGCALPAGVEGFAAPNPSTAGGLFGSDPSTAAESRHDVGKGYSFNLLKPPGMTLDKQRYGWGFNGHKRQRSMPQADHGSGGSASSSGEPSVMESSAATTSGDRASSRKGVDQAIVSTNLSTDTLAFGFGKAVGGCLASRAGYTRPAGRGAGECLGRTFALQPSTSLAYLTKTNRPQTGSSRDPVGSGFIVENTISSGLVENGKEAVSSCRR